MDGASVRYPQLRRVRPRVINLVPVSPGCHPMSVDGLAREVQPSLHGRHVVQLPQVIRCTGVVVVSADSVACTNCEPVTPKFYAPIPTSFATLSAPDQSTLSRHQSGSKPLHLCHIMSENWLSRM